MKIYTRTGDCGSTGLFGGPRVEKDDARIETYGTVDELNAVLGVARAAKLDPRCDAMIDRIQHELFSAGAELASPEPDKHGLRIIGTSHIQNLEHWIDEAERELPPLTSFVLPAGSMGATQLHVARAVCRRCERRWVCLRAQCEPPLDETIGIYLNRLSDLLFVLARRENQLAGVGDQVWKSPVAPDA